jgi:hypothetical protein
MAGISITLGGNFQKLDELKGKARTTAASIKDSFKKIGDSAAFKGLAVGATAAFAGIVASMKKAIAAGSELSDMMAKTGASGRGLLILGKAFENAGLSANEVGNSIARMQKALAGLNEDGKPTSQVFAKLGLSVKELIAMDPADALMQIGASISRLPDPANRAAAAMDIFGRSGANLNVVFNDAAALDTARTQLGGLADLLPGMSADADFVADAFGSIGDKTTQLGAGIAAELMPNLLQVAKWMNEADFTEVGTRIGMIGVKVAKLAELFGKLAKLSPAYQLGKAAEWVAFDGGSLTGKERAEAIAKAREEADKLYQESANSRGNASAAEVFNPFEAAREQGRMDSEAKAAKEAERAARAAEAKAEAAAKATAETEKSRAAAGEEYRLESAILAARLKGDADRLAALEREKAIRMEMKRLEAAGFSAAEARKPAEAKVDAEKKATAAETRRQAAIDEKQRIQEILAGRVNTARERLDSHGFQSSLGAVSSMQRIGGGGGAVASGLDYARQNSDLLRELNEGMRQLIQVSRQPVES